MTSIPKEPISDYQANLTSARDFIQHIKIHPSDTSEITYDHDKYKAYQEFVSQCASTQFYIVYDTFQYKGKLLIRDLQLYDSAEFHRMFTQAKLIIDMHNRLNFNHYPAYLIQNLYNPRYSVYNLIVPDNVQIIYRRVINAYN